MLSIEQLDDVVSEIMDYVASNTDAAYDPLLADERDSLGNFIGRSLVAVGRCDTDASYHLLSEISDYTERLYEDARESLKEDTGKEDDGDEEAYEYITDYMGDIGYMVDYVIIGCRTYVRVFWSGDIYFSKAAWTHELEEQDTVESVVEAFKSWVAAN